ncbi:MAG TPA: phosphoglycerate dehydrogenase, partial [Anaerolineales bacterium]|nr:phosphoglycerate dehydrogenase [Anaerolineales bacterium]
MPTVLVSAPYMIAPLDRFRSGLEKLGLKLLVADVHERLEEADILAYAGSFDGTICGDDHYTAGVLEACSPRLKVISKWGTGVDSIDSGACQRLGIKLYRTTNAFTTPVADSVLAYMLAFARRTPWMDREMKAGRWQKDPGHSLSERILGVIGVGNIGKAVTRRARAFGMRVLGNDIIDVDHVFVGETGIEMTDLHTLLTTCDYVSVNCDLNPGSHHLLDHKAFSLMKLGAILINTARGSIVDEPALVAALQAGRLGGAALDVFEKEPLPEANPLRYMENVLLAPHNSNSSPA